MPRSRAPLPGWCRVNRPALHPAAVLYFALGADGRRVDAVREAAGWAADHAGASDWRLVTRRLAGVRALGVASRTATKLGIAVPAQEAERWRRGAMVADFRQARLAAALGEALATLNGAAVPALLLKGAALASTVYTDGFLGRPMSDLDILVPGEQAAAGYDALRRVGWSADPAPGRAAFYAAHHHLPPLSCPESGALLELHRTALPPGHPFAWSDDAFWSRARAVDVAGVPGLVPATEEMLLHAAVHFAWAHELRAVSWMAVRDIAALAPLVDWDRIAALADERRAGTSVYWAVRLAQQLGSAELPAGALCDQQPRRWRAVRRILERHFILDLAPPGPPVTAARLRRACWTLAIAPGASGHAAARPWRSGGARAGSDPERAPGADRGPASGDAARWRERVRRAMRELRRSPRWLAWTRAVLFGA